MYACYTSYIYIYIYIYIHIYIYIYIYIELALGHADHAPRLKRLPVSNLPAEARIKFGAPGGLGFTWKQQVSAAGFPWDCRKSGLEGSVSLLLQQVLRTAVIFFDSGSRGRPSQTSDVYARSPENPVQTRNSRFRILRSLQKRLKALLRESIQPIQPSKEPSLGP